MISKLHVFTQFFPPAHRRRALVLCLVLGALGLNFFVTADEREYEFTLTTFDVPDSTGTSAASINPEGAITGWYSDASGAHGFLRHPHGSFTTFDPPGSSGTLPQSINPEGAIAGSYFANQMEHGFVRDRDGAFITFDPPGCGETDAVSISPEGAITGYCDGPSRLGFLRARDGTMTTLNPPGSVLTFPTGINSEGTITGSYTLPCYECDRSHGFVRARDGTITTFDPPGSSVTDPKTYPVSINPDGVITGYFFESISGEHAFVLRTKKDVDPERDER